MPSSSSRIARDDVALYTDKERLLILIRSALESLKDATIAISVIYLIHVEVTASITSNYENTKRLGLSLQNQCHQHTRLYDCTDRYFNTTAICYSSTLRTGSDVAVFPWSSSSGSVDDKVKFCVGGAFPEDTTLTDLESHTPTHPDMDTSTSVVMSMHMPASLQCLDQSTFTYPSYMWDTDTNIATTNNIWASVFNSTLRAGLSFKGLHRLFPFSADQYMHNYYPFTSLIVSLGLLAVVVRLTGDAPKYGRGYSDHDYTHIDRGGSGNGYTAAGNSVRSSGAGRSRRVFASGDSSVGGDSSPSSATPSPSSSFSSAGTSTGTPPPPLTALPWELDLATAMNGVIRTRQQNRQRAAYMRMLNRNRPTTGGGSSSSSNGSGSLPFQYTPGRSRVYSGGDRSIRRVNDQYSPQFGSSPKVARELLSLRASFFLNFLVATLLFVASNSWMLMTDESCPVNEREEELSRRYRYSSSLSLNDNSNGSAIPSDTALSTGLNSTDMYAFCQELRTCGLSVRRVVQPFGWSENDYEDRDGFGYRRQLNLFAWIILGCLFGIIYISQGGTCCLNMQPPSSSSSSSSGRGRSNSNGDGDDDTGNGNGSTRHAVTILANKLYSLRTRILNCNTHLCCVPVLQGGAYAGTGVEMGRVGVEMGRGEGLFGRIVRWRLERTSSTDAMNTITDTDDTATGTGIGSMHPSTDATTTSATRGYEVVTVESYMAAKRLHKRNQVLASIYYGVGLGVGDGSLSPSEQSLTLPDTTATATITYSSISPGFDNYEHMNRDAWHEAEANLLLQSYFDGQSVCPICLEVFHAHNSISQALLKAKLEENKMLQKKRERERNMSNSSMKNSSDRKHNVRPNTDADIITNIESGHRQRSGGGNEHENAVVSSADDDDDDDDDDVFAHVTSVFQFVSFFPHLTEDLAISGEVSMPSLPASVFITSSLNVPTDGMVAEMPVRRKPSLGAAVIATDASAGASDIASMEREALEMRNLNQEQEQKHEDRKKEEEVEDDVQPDIGTSLADDDDDENDSKSTARLPKMLPCGHVFHLSCIAGWAVSSGTCPVCRAFVDGIPGYDGAGNSTGEDEYSRYDLV